MSRAHDNAIARLEELADDTRAIANNAAAMKVGTRAVIDRLRELEHRSADIRGDFELVIVERERNAAVQR